MTGGETNMEGQEPITKAVKAPLQIESTLLIRFSFLFIIYQGIIDIIQIKL